MRGDSKFSGWGGLGKNFHWSQKNPFRQKLTHCWYFKHERKLSGSVCKPKCCQNWCKIVIVFVKFLGTNLSGVTLVQKRDECQMGGGQGWGGLVIFLPDGGTLAPPWKRKKPGYQDRVVVSEPREIGMNTWGGLVVLKKYHKMHHALHGYSMHSEKFVHFL